MAFKKAWYVEQINKKLEQYNIVFRANVDMTITQLADMFRFFQVARIQTTQQVMKNHDSEFNKIYINKVKRKFDR